jgi:hypothetical protein
MADLDDVIEVDIASNSYRAQYDYETTTPSMAVVDLVHTITDEPPTELPPLYDAVDPEALNALVGRSAGKSGQCTVTFSYRTLLITVRDDGEVVVRPRSDTDDTDGSG